MVVWLHFSRFLELIVFPQVLILSVKGDVGADEPEDKMLKGMCHLLKKLLGKLGRGMRTAVVDRMGNEMAVEGRDLVLKMDSFFF